MNTKNQSLPGPASRSTAAGNLDAFTLIDLAVVIAIIGLLAVMVLPTLAGTKGRACAANDISNFKQTMTGMMMYCNENNDYMPAPGWNNGSACWIIAANIQPAVMANHTLANYQTHVIYQTAWFTGIGKPPMIIGPPGPGQLYQYLKNPNIFRCPEDMVVNSAYLARGELISSYIWNGAIVAYGENAFDVSKPYKISRFKPTNILQWEGNEKITSGGIWNDFSGYPSDGGNPAFSQRHGNAAPVGRIDGSAGHVLYADMVNWANDTNLNDLWYSPITANGH